MFHSVTMSARRQPRKGSACPSARRTGGTTSVVLPVHLLAFQQLQQGSNAPFNVKGTVEIQNVVILRRKQHQPAHQTVHKLSEGDKPWRSASSMKMSITTAITRHQHQLAHQTVPRPLEGEKPWQSVINTKISTTTATTRHQQQHQ